jgi:general secretion pathway protein F
VEPLILIVMGGLVMAMVLAILLPIVSLNGLANG